jgi:hypothetical protein
MGFISELYGSSSTMRCGTAAVPLFVVQLPYAMRVPVFGNTTPAEKQILLTCLNR